MSVKLIILLAPFDQIEGLTKENMSYIRSQDHSKAHFNNQYFVRIFQGISPETKQEMNNLATQSVVRIEDIAFQS